MVEDFGFENPIPLLSMSSEILEKIIKYCTHHVDHPPCPMETPDDVDPWDVDLVKVDCSTLFHLALAAQYLHIRSLFDMVCRRVFNIKNDLTPPELEDITREVPWAFNNS